VPTSDSDSPSPLMSARIVAAFVSYNSLPAADLPSLIQSVHAALAGIASGAIVAVEPEAPARTPAISARRSIQPDYLICLDDGGKFRSLKRHLAGLGMTPQQYREKWKLPSDYPMVAPNYAAVRSALAKKIGLGQMNRGRARPRKALARAI
jgi:predicted transcriptional regulator